MRGPGKGDLEILRLSSIFARRSASFLRLRDASAPLQLPVGSLLGTAPESSKKRYDHYRLALRIDPSHVKARYYLAVALAEQGDFQAAGKEFQESLRVEPNLAEAHAGLARALSAQGKKDQALQHYQEAVRLLKSQSQNKNEGSNQ